MGKSKVPRSGRIVGAETHGAQAVALGTSYREREEFYRTILDNLAEGVVITDAEGRIRYANARMEEISGYAPEELMGRVVYEVLAQKKNWEQMQRRLDERLTGLTVNYEIELMRKDGRASWISVSGAPYRDGTGQIVGAVGTISCIDRQKTLERQNEYLQEELRDVTGTEELIGPSASLARIREQVRMVASTGASVLITGESGTGKELVARAIHEGSGRRNKPLVRVNCAAIPRELYESEFFGHVRGAFTGAIRDRIGRFELANGGTLFLDEIGEIPLELQGKLLRVIQEGQFERVGEERTRTVDVRLVSATNRDLEREAAAGQFRLDLYYRLSVFPIAIPPLRERREDIAPLAAHFLRIAAQRLLTRAPEMSAAQIRELDAYHWPGNVRELQNVMERAAILAAHGAFSLPIGRVAPPEPEPLRSGGGLGELKEREKEMLREALRKTRGKIYGRNGAAALLGLKPTTLSSKLERLGLRREAFFHG